MIRKAIRTATVLLAALAIPAAVLAASPPANAVNGNTMCETYGAYCLNTADFSLYTPVTERLAGGRYITAVLITNITFEGRPVFKLVFNGDTSKCVAAANNNSDVVIHSCEDANGVIWALRTNNGSDMWINRQATGAFNQDMYLSGRNCGGCQYELYALGVSGAYQKFS
jgi:hypothetical protein